MSVAEIWSSQGQPEMYSAASLVQLPVQARLTAAGEVLQFLAALCTKLTEKAEPSWSSSKLIEC